MWLEGMIDSSRANEPLTRMAKGALRGVTTSPEKFHGGRNMKDPSPVYILSYHCIEVNIFRTLLTNKECHLQIRAARVMTVG